MIKIDTKTVALALIIQCDDKIKKLEKALAELTAKVEAMNTTP